MIELRAGHARASIALRGAEAVAWHVGDLSVLWNADPAWWQGTAPILFPLVGRCRSGSYRIGATMYPMGLHGFAAARDFRPVRTRSTEAVLELVDDRATRAQYPFAFRLRASYRLGTDSLRIGLSVANTGSDAMPYAIGLHPGFPWPLGGGARSETVLRFSRPEARAVPSVTEQGLFAPRLRDVPFDGLRLVLGDALFGNDALCWFGLRSRSARYGGDQTAAIRISWEGFPHLAVWSKPGAPFICVEHWTAASDPEDFTGGIFDKPGIAVLRPGEERRHAVRYMVEALRHA
ncbi:MAG: aldose 1-epimerase family protein [Acetobacteraceae bacterium]|nr:aldose 1-epimerase family protein [Acetobacteraceae bacterium]